MKVPMLLKNKYVLYVLLFVGIMNILGYVALEQYNALALFVVLGLLSSYFSKNMSVNLLVPIIGTGLMVVNDKVQEGFEEAHDNVEKNLKPQSVKSTARSHPTSSASEQSLSDTGDALVKVSQKARQALKKAKSAEKKTASSTKDSQKQAQPVEEEEPQAPFAGCAKGTSCPQGKVCNSQSECVTGFKNNVPPSSPAAVNPADDESVGDRIDYAATMEQAYDNLQKMLGEGGMKNITNETKKLVTQQKDLMRTINSMAPVLNQAKETLKGMDLPNMGNLGNMIKKLKSV